MRPAPLRALPLLALCLAVLVAGCRAGAGVRAPAPTSPVPFDIQVQLRERFYPVSGLNARALNRALALNGPKRAGRSAHALTEWHLDWSYRPVSSGSGCSARPAVSVSVVTTLPRWVDRAGASEGLANDWALFLARLRDHESIHQYLALEGGRELLRQLGALVAADCAQLEQEAQQLVSSLQASYQEEQLRFDLESEYGRKPLP